MSNFDQRIIWVLSILMVLIAKPAVCDDTSFYAPFQTLLDRHLNEQSLPCGGLISWFDYEGALASISTASLLKTQDERLAEFDPDTLGTRERALAFWTNAYNYFMIQHLLTHPENNQPVASVRDYGSLFRPYRVFGLKRFNVGGEDHSLREIELDILLGDDFAKRGWKDARIHFAVNCASVGCPPLRKTLYSAASLDAMLTENTRLALDTPIHLTQDNQTLRLTELFDWYEDDFIDHSGSVLEFIAAYGSTSAIKAANNTDRITFIDYDWRLNTVENFSELTQC